MAESYLTRKGGGGGIQLTGEVESFLVDSASSPIAPGDFVSYKKIPFTNLYGIVKMNVVTDISFNTSVYAVGAKLSRNYAAFLTVNSSGNSLAVGIRRLNYKEQSDTLFSLTSAWGSQVVTNNSSGIRRPHLVALTETKALALYYDSILNIGVANTIDIAIATTGDINSVSVGNNQTLSNFIPKINNGLNSVDNNLTSVLKLSSSQVLVVFADTANNNVLKATVLTVSGTSVTASTPVTIGNNNMYPLSILKKSDTQYLILIRNAGSSNQLAYIPFTYINNVITYSPVITTTLPFGGGFNGVPVCQVNDSTFIAVSTNNNILSLYSFTENSVTFLHSTKAYRPGQAINRPYALGKTGKNKVIITYASTGTLTLVNSKVYKIENNKLILEYPLQTRRNINQDFSSNGVDIVQLDNDVVIFPNLPSGASKGYTVFSESIPTVIKNDNNSVLGIAKTGGSPGQEIEVYLAQKTNSFENSPVEGSIINRLVRPGTVLFKNQGFFRLASTPDVFQDFPRIQVPVTNSYSNDNAGLSSVPIEDYNVLYTYREGTDFKIELREIMNYEERSLANHTLTSFVPQALKLVKYNNNKVLMIYVAGNLLYYRIITINKNENEDYSFTIGDPVSINPEISFNPGGRGHSFAVHSRGNKIIILTKRTTVSPLYVFAKIITFDGTTVDTSGTILDLGTTFQYFTVNIFNENRALVFTHSGSSNLNYYILNVSTLNPTILSSSSVSNEVPPDNGFLELVALEQEAKEPINGIDFPSNTNTRLLYLLTPTGGNSSSNRTGVGRREIQYNETNDTFTIGTTFNVFVNPSSADFVASPNISQISKNYYIITFYAYISGNYHPGVVGMKVGDTNLAGTVFTSTGAVNNVYPTTGKNLTIGAGTQAGQFKFFWFYGSNGLASLITEAPFASLPVPYFVGTVEGHSLENGTGEVNIKTVT